MTMTRPSEKAARVKRTGSTNGTGEGTANPGTNRLDWLDALRGWAVFGVLMVHSGSVAHSTGVERAVSAAGQYGVQLFFVVSALTISMTYESHIRSFGRSAKSQFAWLIKRFFRIAPLYYLAILAYPVERYAMYVLSHHRYGVTTNGWDMLAQILFLHTWIPSADLSVVPGGWSIGVEMFFYALVPFIWLLTPVRRRIMALASGAVAFLMATVLVSKLATGSYYVVDDTYFYYWFPTQAPVIILGLIFYFLYGAKLRNSRSPRVATACFVGFLLCLLVGIYLGTGNEVAPMLAPTILASSFILLILSLQGWVKRAVVSVFAVFLGKISFSVYIFHFVVLDLILWFFHAVHYNRSGPLTVFPVFIVTLAVTSGIALISKRILEDPAIAYGHKLSRSLAQTTVSGNSWYRLPAEAPARQASDPAARS
jgi:peptidoglycan/LPS O-acetylase OafA/YrhL